MDMRLSELQELVMNREAWSAVIHGVAKNRTQLSDWTELNLPSPEVGVNVQCGDVEVIWKPWNELDCIIASYDTNLKY